jgi:hypothetical protein
MLFKLYQKHFLIHHTFKQRKEIWGRKTRKGLVKGYADRERFPVGEGFRKIVYGPFIRVST